jgi:phospholipase A1
MLMRCIFFLFLFFSFSSFSETILNETDIKTQDDTSDSTIDAVDLRLKEEARVESFKFSMIPHKPTYLLPFNFNDKINNYTMYEDVDGINSIQNIEIKYQISFKTPLFHHIDHLPISGYFAYTQTSFWQAYNTDQSSPFRETNYEPEMFLWWDLNKELWADVNFKAATFGFAHQSNGRSDPISRSWNRLETNFVFSKGHIAIAFTPWYRIDQKDAESDDNPELLDYYGHGQITLVYSNADRVFSLISRNNLESGFSKGSIQASLSFPLFENVKGYVQLFSGYGNSLIEYDVYTNTIGFGISITDFL